MFKWFYYQVLQNLQGNWRLNLVGGGEMVLHGSLNCVIYLFHTLM